MNEGLKIFGSNEPYEREIPARCTTFEAQVLVIALPCKEIVNPILAFAMAPCIYDEAFRVIHSGN